MTPSFSRASTIILLMVFFAITAFSQRESSAVMHGQREKLAVFPFVLHGLSSEEGAQLTRRFADLLGESDRFEVIVTDSLKGMGGILDPRSLADAGKACSVQKVVHVDAVRREKLTVLRIRLVNVSDVALLYAERINYSGEFGTLLSDVIPEQAHKLTQAHLDAKTPWAKAALLFGACLGAILWIFWHLRSKGAVREDTAAGSKQ
jgi:TolB-like protein